MVVQLHHCQRTHCSGEHVAQQPSGVGWTGHRSERGNDASSPAATSESGWHKAKLPPLPRPHSPPFVPSDPRNAALRGSHSLRGQPSPPAVPCPPVSLRPLDSVGQGCGWCISAPGSVRVCACALSERYTHHCISTSRLRTSVLTTGRRRDAAEAIEASNRDGPRYQLQPPDTASPPIPSSPDTAQPRLSRTTD